MKLFLSLILFSLFGLQSQAHSNPCDLGSILRQEDLETIYLAEIPLFPQDSFSAEDFNAQLDRVIQSFQENFKQEFPRHSVRIIQIRDANTKKIIVRKGSIIQVEIILNRTHQGNLKIEIYGKANDVVLEVPFLVYNSLDNSVFKHSLRAQFIPISLSKASHLENFIERVTSTNMHISRPIILIPETQERALKPFVKGLHGAVEIIYLPSKHFTQYNDFFPGRIALDENAIHIFQLGSSAPVRVEIAQINLALESPDDLQKMRNEFIFHPSNKIKDKKLATPDQGDITPKPKQTVYKHLNPQHFYNGYYKDRRHSSPAVRAFHNWIDANPGKAEKLRFAPDIEKRIETIPDNFAPKVDDLLNGAYRAWELKYLEDNSQIFSRSVSASDFGGPAGVKYSPNESHATMNRYGSYRKFTMGGKTETIERHLGTNASGGGRPRLYFGFDDDAELIWVHYLGEHLPSDGYRS